MDIDWDSLAGQFEQLMSAGPKRPEDLAAISEVLGLAASVFPKDSPGKLAWLTAALSETPKKWFVAKVLERVNPVPRALFDPLLTAALTEPNPSASRLFIDPCIRTFGQPAVRERIRELAVNPGMNQGEGLASAMYWIDKAR